MQIILEKGALRARLAQDAGDVAAAQRLRGQAFLAERGDADRCDADAFDARCTHVLIEERESGTLVGCFRLLFLTRGAEIGGSYSAQFYDLSGLAAYGGPMAELGRFCAAPGRGDPDIVRLAWGALTRLIETRGAGMLFGCTSFRGADPTLYADAFGLLLARHLGPASWRPEPKAREVVPFTSIAPERPDLKRAARATPALLRAYLAMGGWVGDHAVIDRSLDTVHVFTALEVAAIPEGRMRLLRASAS
ncbi:GNAT family N-acetyltransferase [Profundibacterium mesophilum]|uniref:L-ornithine N(alpha)-acyltransferase n=1 Tax=Profundibacterium mesophilum KAUST100406-0324 TaxID=1037889 RepID=A0A921NVM2_9RHOB|nr:GNAT family N-acetyltransferase [Profundibacterium mesophilum]KAF0677524.1 Ornithine-acylacyl carrier protein N-acyltransferase [Profundibacterium mesophilum KAUST100406-0324]